MCPALVMIEVGFHIRQEMNFYQLHWPQIFPKAFHFLFSYYCPKESVIKTLVLSVDKCRIMFTSFFVKMAVITLDTPRM